MMKHPLPLRRPSFSTSSGRSSPGSVDGMQISNSSYMDDHHPAASRTDKESKLLDRRRYDNTLKEIMTDTMSLDSSDDNNMMYRRHPEDVHSHTDIHSPSHNAFGSREQRSSFRRYEIEHMEPRPLPHNNGNSWYGGSEENLLTTTQQQQQQQQQQHLKMNRNSKVSSDHNMYSHSPSSSIDEQRASLRNVMVGKVVTGSSGKDIVPATTNTQKRSNPGTPNGNRKADPNTPNGNRKVDASWYEYGHV